MQLGISSNLRDVERDLSDVARKQVPFAMSLAINETAADLIELNRRNMARTFDAPTRWTLNAFHFTRATKARQVATIKRKQAAASRDYLLRQSEGGARKQTGLERLLNTRLAYSGQVGFVVPTKHMPRNRHGNMQPGQVQRLLSGLKAQNDGAQNETDASAKRQRRSGAARYFVPKEGGRMSPGVYMRKGKAAPVKVLAFTSKAPRYQARFKFYPNMNKAAARIMPGRFARAFAAAMSTAR